MTEMVPAVPTEMFVRLVIVSVTVLPSPVGIVLRGTTEDASRVVATQENLCSAHCR